MIVAGKIPYIAVSVKPFAKHQVRVRLFCNLAEVGEIEGRGVIILHELVIMLYL